MKSILLTSIMVVFAINFLWSQKEINALKISEPITIDGQLTEEAWINNTSIAKDFVNLDPIQGELPNNYTEVKLLYTDEALYVGAYMQDESRDSIMTELTERDDFGNTDFFGFYIDTYCNGQDAFEFIAAATAGQFDAKVTQNGEDNSWDAVWEVAVHLTDKGWYAEFMIPYSALRFPKEDIQDWQINFIRRRSVSGEKSFWQEIDLNVDNPILTRTGKIRGIQNIKPPVRLSLLPYVSLYGLHSHDNERDPVNSTGYSYNFGMDLKYGINDAFTLDMTLIPDFGQVQSDDEILNLSPFEVRYSENRPFFTEGIELFEKADIFYSRRVGEQQQLYNATKVTGRNNNGLGIGIFNAVGAQEMVEGTEGDSIVAPFTNYNITVFDQNLKNNSNLSIINTNVTRFNNDFQNANVTATEFLFKDEAQSIGLGGSAALSQIINKNGTTDYGHAFEIELEKLKGDFTYGSEYEEKSGSYDQSDLGYQRQTNYRELDVYAGFSKFDGLWKFSQFNSWFNMEYTRLIDPDVYTSVWFNTGFWGQLKSFWQLNMWANYSPERYDYFEPRVEGRYFKRPSLRNIGLWLGSDGRKKFAANGYIFGYKLGKAGYGGYEFVLRPRFRFSNKLNCSLDLRFEQHNNGEGFVTDLSDDEIIFGQRDQNTIVNVLNINYSFSDKMGLDLRLRHYWTKITYDQYFELGLEGDLLDTDYNGFNDFTFSRFNIDMIYRWRFAPGSDMFIVWKNNIAGVNDDESQDFSKFNYGNGIKELGDFAQNNSLSVRMVYYIDYNQQLKKIF